MRGGPGSKIDRFEVVRELGRGGMGVVFEARDTVSGQRVALKLLTRVDPQRLLRFVREGEISASLRHPGIVAIHAAGVSDGMAWLAFELVFGARTFKQALDGLSLGRRVELLRDAARALGYAHARGVVHRDVKPDNLLVGADHRVRVADFGVALGCDLERLTTSGALLGTPLYMAPELLLGQRGEVGPRSDVWALGVMLYETACGRPPFGSGTLTALIDDVTRPPPRPRAVAPDVAPSLEAVILRAMAIDPAGRHADGEALALDLDRFLDGEEVAAPRRPPASGRTLVRVGVLLTLAFAAPALGYLLAPGRRATPAVPVEPVVASTGASTSIVDASAVAAVATTLRGRTDHLMEQARDAYSSGRFADVVTIYSEVIELDPSDYRTWANRAAAQIHLKNYVAGIADASRALELDATGFEAWYTRGSAYFQVGERDLALRDLTRSIDLAPGAPEGRLLRARVYVALGQPASACADLDALLVLDPHRVDALERRSKLRESMGELAGARSDLDRLLDLAGPRVEVLVDRSALSVRLGDLAGALTDLDAALALGPHDEVLLRRARLLYRLGRLPEGLRDADSAVTLTGAPACHSVRAGLRLGARDFEGALADATEALRRGSKDPMDHAHRGLALGSLGRRAEAVPDLTAAIDAGMKDLQLWQCRGFGLDELGRREEALADFDHVLSVVPGDFGARYGRGRVRRLLSRDLEGAVEDLGQAIAAQPRNGGLFLERGIVHELLGRTGAAVTDLREAVRLLPPRSPQHVEAARRLTYLVP